MQDIKTLINNNKQKIITAAILIICITVFSVFVYKHFNKDKNVEIYNAPPIITDKDIEAAFKINDKNINETDAKSIKKEIQYITKTEPARYEYYTTTDKQADAVAKDYSQKEKADAIIKQQDSQQVGNTTVYDNKYYAITNEKKHDIKLGAGVIDSALYTTITYRNRDIDYTALYSPKNNNIGVLVQATVARW